MLLKSQMGGEREVVTRHRRNQDEPTTVIRGSLLMNHLLRFPKTVGNTGFIHPPMSEELFCLI